MRGLDDVVVDRRYGRVESVDQSQRRLRIARAPRAQLAFGADGTAVSHIRGRRAAKVPVSSPLLGLAVGIFRRPTLTCSSFARLPDKGANHCPKRRGEVLTIAQTGGPSV